MAVTTGRAVHAVPADATRTRFVRFNKDGKIQLMIKFRKFRQYTLLKKEFEKYSWAMW